jgi:hypothetical protein
VYFPPVCEDFMMMPIPTCYIFIPLIFGCLDFIIKEDRLTIVTRHSAERYAALCSPICHDFWIRGTLIFAGEPHFGL